MEDALRLFSDSFSDQDENSTFLDNRDKYVYRSFLLTKQKTIVSDFEDSGLSEYNKLNFLEFLEFFARVAMMRFYHTELEKEDLSYKIEHLMDVVFQKCLQCERVKEPEDEYHSADSDEDY